MSEFSLRGGIFLSPMAAVGQDLESLVDAAAGMAALADSGLSLRTALEAVKSKNMLASELFQTIHVDEYDICEAKHGLANVLNTEYFQRWTTITVYIDLHWDVFEPQAESLKGALLDLWTYSIETWWSNRFACASGTGLACPLIFRVSWGQHAGDFEIFVDDEDPEDKRSNATMWEISVAALKDPSLLPDYDNNIGMGMVHEFGHLIGLFDEYEEGACDGGVVNTTSIMADMWTTTNPDFPARLFQRFADNIACSLVPLQWDATTAQATYTNLLNAVRSAAILG